MTVSLCFRSCRFMRSIAAGHHARRRAPRPLTDRSRRLSRKKSSILCRSSVSKRDHWAMVPARSIGIASSAPGIASHALGQRSHATRLRGKATEMSSRSTEMRSRARGIVAQGLGMRSRSHGKSSRARGKSRHVAQLRCQPPGKRSGATGIVCHALGQRSHATRL